MNIYEMYGRLAEENIQLKEKVESLILLLKDIKEGKKSIDDVEVKDEKGI